MNKNNKHLPIFGIGSMLCFPMAVISAVAIVLSLNGIIPFTITNKQVKLLFIVIGILVIIEGVICFLGADFGGGLVEYKKQ